MPKHVSKISGGEIMEKSPQATKGLKDPKALQCIMLNLLTGYQNQSEIEPQNIEDHPSVSLSLTLLLRLFHFIYLPVLLLPFRCPPRARCFN